MPERGVIGNRDYASQLRDFSKMRFGTITPTDADMLIEYHDKYFIYAETKHGDTELKEGQRLALERLCDATQRSGKPSILFITSHNTPPEMDIDMAETVVVEYRYLYQWGKPVRACCLRAATASFIRWQDELRVAKDMSSRERVPA